MARRPALRGVCLGLISTLAMLAMLESPARAQTAPEGVDLTCAMALTRLDHTTTNVLALDTNAVYWVAPYVALPGTRIRVDGRFPHARYIGFNVYDPIGHPEDAIADLEIEPNPASTNPFRAGADRDAGDRSYTLFVEFGPEPEEPAANTLYTGDSLVGTLWYRVYIPDEGHDRKGGAPIPRVTLEPAGAEGGSALGAVEGCDELQLPYLDAVTDLIAELPGIPAVGAAAFPGRDPPSWRLFVNLARAAADILLDNELGEALHEPVLGALEEGAGYFANRDISYVFAPTSRAHGEVLVVEARAPTFADTRSGPATMPTGHETRYWSLCQYEPATQRVIACLADDRIPVDEDGNFRLVVSNASERPANARAECGFGWLPWGPTTQGLLIYRHMLAAPDFEFAIGRVPEPGLERDTLGPYHPQSSYLQGAWELEQLGC